METSESSPTREVVSSENTKSSSNASDNIITKHSTNTLTTFDHVPWPVRPSQGINYDFVAMMYLAGSGIAIFFLLLEKQILSPLLLEDENNNNCGNNTHEPSFEDTIEEGTEDGEDVNPWKEFAKGMEGMYVIFIPFIPCLLWSLVVRYYWLKETDIESRKKKDE